MSLQSVHARMTDIAQMMSQTRTSRVEQSEQLPAAQKAVRSAKSEQAFQALLERSTEKLAEDSAAKRQQNSGNGGLRVRSAAPAMYVASARQGSPAAPSEATWTGSVDTSDGMLEKAAPYMDVIREASAVYGVPANVIMGVIKAESDFQVICRSHSGAMGLMQVMPENMVEFGITDAYDPRQNIMCGTAEIAYHLKNYDGDLKLALTAYNIGGGRVRRSGVTSSDSAAYYSAIPESVQAYTDRVLRYAGLAS